MHLQSKIWQHVKSGGLYRVISSTAYIEADLTPAVVYESLWDGQVWARPHEEFFDGRFINIAVDEVADCRPIDERLGIIKEVVRSTSTVVTHVCTSTEDH